jgi:hypothetical protein
VVETLLRAALIANGTFTALAGQRVYAEVMPQNPTYPAVVYNRITTERDSAMGADSGLVAAVVQFTCFAQSGAGVSGYDAALALANAVRGVVQRFRSGAVQDCFVVNETTTFEFDTRNHGRVLDVRVHYLET